MPSIQYGIPGGSLAADSHCYGSAARAGAFFERRVAGALARWLNGRPESTHLFHDLQRLRSRSRTGRRLDLGQTNIDHVLLTGAGWVMFDAKGIAPGRLVVDKDRGQLITPAGERRPQPWLDDRRSYAQAGVLCDLTDLTGTMIWVVPEDVDFSALFTDSIPRCLAAGGGFITIDDLANGTLEAALPFPPPYAPASEAAIAALKQHVVDAA